MHFIHIPKTAGMAARLMLRNSGWKNVYDDQKGNLQVGEGKEYHGHMPYSHWKDWAPAKESLFEFTIVRNPVRRMASLIDMWFKEKFGEAWAQASQGGSEWNNDEVRKILFETGALRALDVPTEELFVTIVCYFGFLEEDPKVAQLIKNIGITTQEEYDALVIKGQRICIQNYTKNLLKTHVNPDLGQITWLDCLDFYFKNNDLENVDRIGVGLCPMHLYPSERTKIYKQEEMQGMVDDLYRLNAIDSDDLPPPTNEAISKLMPGRSSQWSDNPELRDTFFGLYEKDFDLFDYDRSTPFPNMK